MFFRTTTARTSGQILKVVEVATEPALTYTVEQTLPIQEFNVASFYRDYDTTPDGEHLLMVYSAAGTDALESATPQINIVLNWFEELKERVPVP